MGIFGKKLDAKNDVKKLFVQRVDNEGLDFDGTDPKTGKTIKLRQLKKNCKDVNGIYLYTGYLDYTNGEDTAEILSGEPLGAYICFTTTRRKVEDIEESDQNDIKELLALLSSVNPKIVKNPDGSLDYIGHVGEHFQTGKLLDGLRQISPAIADRIQLLQRNRFNELANEDMSNWYK